MQTLHPVEKTRRSRADQRWSSLRGASTSDRLCDAEEPYAIGAPVVGPLSRADAEYLREQGVEP